MTSTNAHRIPTIVGLALALAAALVLRATGIEGQVLADDELHSVHAALAMPVGEIFQTWTFDGADYGVPTTLIHRFAMDRGLVFSELTFRAVSLAAGLVAIVLIPWLAAPRLGHRGAIGLSWLLAISPMLATYSQIARPYMLATLLLSCAVLLFDRWLRERSRSTAVACAFAASLAIYSHLATAPAVAGLFLFGAMRLGPHPSAARPLLGLVAATGLLVGALLLPAWESLVSIITTTRDGQPPSASAWFSVLRLQVGSLSGAGFIVAGLVAIRGVHVLWKRERVFVTALASVIAAQLAGLVLLAPDRLEEAVVLNRYVLVVLPLALMPLAVGATEPWWPGRSGRGGWVEVALATGGLILLFLGGPLASEDRERNSFRHSLTSIDFNAQGNRIDRARASRFYRDLANSIDSPVIEYPWQNMSFHAFDAYQRIHGQPVLVASVIDRRREKRLSLTNHVDPDPDSILASNARYFIVHFDLHSETRQIESSDPHLDHWLRARRELWAPLRRAGNVMFLELSRTWGAPFYEDGVIAVWDLDAVRGDKKVAP